MSVRIRRIASPAVWHDVVPVPTELNIERTFVSSSNLPPLPSRSRPNSRLSRSPSPQVTLQEEFEIERPLSSSNSTGQDSEVCYSSDSYSSDSPYEVDTDSEFEFDFKMFHESTKDIRSTCRCYVCSTCGPNVITLDTGLPAHVQCLEEEVMQYFPSKGLNHRCNKNTCKELTAERIYRKKAKENQNCLICLQEEPDVATLCCGKVMHVNCMTRWLNENKSCPNCRSNMSAIESPGRNNNVYGMMGQPRSSRTVHIFPSLPADSEIYSILMPPMHDPYDSDYRSDGSYSSYDEDLSVSTPTGYPPLMTETSDDYEHLSSSLTLPRTGASQMIMGPYEGHSSSTLDSDSEVWCLFSFEGVLQKFFEHVRELFQPTILFEHE